MQAWLNSLIARGVFGPHPSPLLVYTLAIAIACAVVLFLIAVPFASVVTWVERRVWARIQSRIGPNRVGPNGFLQWLADGVKHVCKEDVIPAEADRRLFKLAPYLVVLAFILPWAVMPFSSSLILADLNIGILYITAVPALTVIGILMAGWASNNKWSLIGGIRSAAQIISYEIPAGLSIFPVVFITGTLSMQGIIRAQGWAPDRWFIFANPFCFVAAIILFVSGLAENNRTPFDLPEAESELVAGFATEYSSMRYLFFFMAEWGNMFIAAAIVVTLFLGGWQFPHVSTNLIVMNALQFVTFYGEMPVPGAGLDVDTGHAPTGAHRSDDVAVLEILRADFVHRYDWHRGLGRHIPGRQHNRPMDNAGPRRCACCVVRVTSSHFHPARSHGTLLPSDNLTGIRWTRQLHTSGISRMLSSVSSMGWRSLHRI